MCPVYLMLTCVCVWEVFNLRKELHCFGLFLHFTGHSPLKAVMENETWPHPSYVPHYLLHGDPFASKLSREADIVAAFYICIIGQSMIAKSSLYSSLLLLNWKCVTSMSFNARISLHLTEKKKCKENNHLQACNEWLKICKIWSFHLEAVHFGHVISFVGWLDFAHGVWDTQEAVYKVWVFFGWLWRKDTVVTRQKGNSSNLQPPVRVMGLTRK